MKPGRLGAVEHGSETSGVDRELEGLLTVDEDHRDPDPVLELERIVGLDVHLLERERRPFTLSEEHLAGVVAEVAPGSREQDDGPHGGEGTQGALWTVW